METVAVIVVALGLVVRVILDVATILKPSATFDLAYGVLFAIVGGVLFVAEGASFWALACAAIAAYSFFSGAAKAQAQTPKSEGDTNGAP